jgi:hypothetical protein
MSLTAAKEAAKNGVFSDDVLAVLRANGYTDEMIRGIYGYVRPMPENPSEDLKKLMDLVKSGRFSSAEDAIKLAYSAQGQATHKNAITDDELDWFAEWLDAQKWED